MTEVPIVLRVLLECRVPGDQGSWVFFNPRATERPPNPAPTITTRGARFWERSNAWFATGSVIAKTQKENNGK